MKPESGPGQASRSGAEERRWGGGGEGGSEHASISVSTDKLQLIHPRSSSVCVYVCVRATSLCLSKVFLLSKHSRGCRLCNWRKNRHHLHSGIQSLRLHPYTTLSGALCSSVSPPALVIKGSVESQKDATRIDNTPRTGAESGFGCGQSSRLRHGISNVWTRLKCAFLDSWLRAHAHTQKQSLSVSLMCASSKGGIYVCMYAKHIQRLCF